METPYGRRRAAGALQFLAELELFAVECAAMGVWDDELTVRRRRQRDEAPTFDARTGAAT
jgi:hypothetical protein